MQREARVLLLDIIGALDEVELDTNGLCRFPTTWRTGRPGARSSVREECASLLDELDAAGLSGAD